MNKAMTVKTERIFARDLKKAAVLGLLPAIRIGDTEPFRKKKVELFYKCIFREFN